MKNPCKTPGMCGAMGCSNPPMCELWEYVEQLRTSAAGRNTHVAMVTSKGLTPDEIEANANLIAAAPDMLDALRLALTLLTDPDAEPAHADTVTDIVRAAIAKAVQS